MSDLEAQIAVLEDQWREADDSLRTARAELAANQMNSPAVVSAIQKRIERAERTKRSILQKIEILEEGGYYEQSF
ncbi:MAG: hypothetical protein AB7T07_00725 [Steroidobacteraceae bacterium]